MTIRILFWSLTLLGIIPVSIFLYGFLRIVTTGPVPVKALLDSSSLHFQINVYKTGNRFVDPFKKEEIKLYPRFWSLIVGILGAFCLIIFAVYTLHIPYR